MKRVLSIFLLTLTALLLFPVEAMTATNKQESDLSFSNAISWLEKEAHRIIRASRREMKDRSAAFPPQVGIGYEAFWLRDYEYTLEGALSAYTDKELTDACRLFVRSLRADGAGVDCVKFDGTPIYQPGYGSMGKNPVADGSQFTVGVAWHTYQHTRDMALLREILDPLVKTLEAVPRNPANRLVHIKPGPDFDRCPYGFTDTIRKQGDELFCSLLFVQACRQLSEPVALRRARGRVPKMGQGRQARCGKRSQCLLGFPSRTVPCGDGSVPRTRHMGIGVCRLPGSSGSRSIETDRNLFQNSLCGAGPARPDPALTRRSLLGGGMPAGHLPEWRLLGDTDRVVRLYPRPHRSQTG